MWFFHLLARFNKRFLPKFYKKDLRRLRPWEKALVGYKVWVTKKILP